MVEWSVQGSRDEPSSSREIDFVLEQEPPACPLYPPSRSSSTRRYRWSYTTSSSAPWAHQLRADSPPHRYFAQKIFIGGARTNSLKWSLHNPAMDITERDDVHMSESMPGTSSYIPGLPPVPPSGTSCFPLGSDVNNIIPSVEAYVYSDHQQAPSMLNMLATFRSQNCMCDVELEVDGEIISAHRCVLAASIPYFRSMFTSLMLEATQSRIKIQDITYESLRLLIDFVYTSTIRIDSDNVQNLLFAASILQMDSVCLACQKFLSRFLTTANCLSIRQFAEQYNCVDLLENTDDFAVDNFSEIRKLEEFFAIPFNHLRDLIKRSDLNVEREEEVFESVVSWIAAEEETRMKYFPELLTYIQLPQLQKKFLVEDVKNHPYIKASTECREIICNALYQMIKNDPNPLKFGAPMKEDCYQYAAGQVDKCNEEKKSIRASRPRKSTAGVIFCAGGRGTAGDPFRSVEAYDWRRNRWLAVPEMTQQRRHVGVVSVMGKLYAIGGHDGQTHLASAEVFDPAAGAWRRIAPMNTSRRGIAVAAIGEAIFAVGGLDDQTCFHTVERYDIELDSWTEAAKMHVQRGGVGVTALDRHLYAVGGNDGTSSLDSCERYDPLLNKWKMIKPMCYRRAGAGVCVMDGYLYALGGFDDNSPLSTCERYNPANDSWENLPTMGSPRGGVGVASMGGYLYAIGGHDGTKYLNTVECFDPLTGVWEPVAEIKECRAGAGVAWANCSITQLLRPFQESGCAPSGGSQCI